MSGTHNAPMLPGYRLDGLVRTNPADDDARERTLFGNARLAHEQFASKWLKAGKAIGPLTSSGRPAELTRLDERTAEMIGAVAALHDLVDNGTRQGSAKNHSRSVSLAAARSRARMAFLDRLPLQAIEPERRLQIDQ